MMDGHFISMDERKQLDAALKRAHEFEKGEELELMRQPLCGPLLKFTNVMQGWQTRWFVLDPSSGELRYYLKEDHWQQEQKPRGVIQLAGAIVVPSDDDGTAFCVTSNSGDGFKLKGSDTRQRQEWINRVRTISEDQRQRRLKDSSLACGRAHVTEDVRRGTALEGALLYQIQQVLSSASEQQQAMIRAIDCLSIDQACNKNTLLLKATSSALLQTLDLCQQTLIHSSETSQIPLNSKTKKIRKKSTRGSISKSERSNSTKSLSHVESQAVDAMLTIIDDVHPGSEIVDNDKFVDIDLDALDDQRPLMISMLSRLKLGTDLSRVSLPAFVLQSRSFLESCSDFLSNAQILIDTPLKETPEERMLQVVKWFLSSFNDGCKGGLTRKPYNPVLGEVFRCVWQIPNPDAQSDPIKISFIAEQVSHHPPVTAVYAHCPARNMHFNAYIWPRCKYMGMSMTTTIVGEIQIVFGPTPERGPELYKLSLPCAFVRSILTSPWFELGGKVTVTCQNTVTSAIAHFNTKPFYGGKLHKVAAEIKSASMNTYARINGEWNKCLEIYNGNNVMVDKLNVSSVSKAVRYIRPLPHQHSRESRKTWNQLTQALRASDWPAAINRKKDVEDLQRIALEKLSREGNSYNSKIFSRKTCPVSGEVSYLHNQFPMLLDL